MGFITQSFGSTTNLFTESLSEIIPGCTKTDTGLLSFWARRNQNIDETATMLTFTNTAISDAL